MPTCLFLMQDDIVLVARTAEALRMLLRIVEKHCSLLKMTLSISKSKIISTESQGWEIYDEEETVGCLEKVVQFKYLGLESQMSPYQGTQAVQKRTIASAKKYKAVCLRVSRDGPDMVEVGVTTWAQIGRPSFLYSTEFVPLSDTAIQELDRNQAAVCKDLLGLSRYLYSLNIMSSP